MEGNDLMVSPLEAEQKPERTVELERLIDERLPFVELSELLIEVDGWTHFSDDFEHAGGTEPRSRELRRHLYAAVLAQACNLGPTRMARISDLTYQKLARCTNWYLRDETLKAATTRLVNFQYHQPLSRSWGGGTLSSSDGQRFPVSGKVRMATALPRYFGYGKGVTFYTWTADQFSQYGTKVIPATVRDATYVLDEILDNETELPLLEHTTDTSGYTEIVFALFDLLGLQFSPRIRDLGDQRLFRLDRQKRHLHLGPLLKGRINRDRILRRWDELLRVAGSLKRGWVTASLLIGKLRSYPRKNRLTRTLQEYSRLIKTIFILRYLESEQLRRRINTQLNKGEALHGLREFLLFANKGALRRKQEEELMNQASCLNLVTNAVVTWNTVYMATVIDQLRAEGRTVKEEDIARLKREYMGTDNPILSIDTKKKELVGNFYREGRLYTQETIETFDHDFPSAASGVIIPHGLYDVKRNDGYVNLGTSHDTSEFACDSIERWWQVRGRTLYPRATSILLLCDGGGSNSASQYLFKEDLHRLVDRIGIEIRVAHYPPYTSKYNPIEHRLFPHLTRACQGAIFENVELVKGLMEKAKTSPGLRVAVDILDKVYQTGRKYAKGFKQTMKIVFDEILPKWNYWVVPSGS